MTRKILQISMFVFLAIMYLVQLYFEPDAPLPGIVSLELAGEPSDARCLVDRWEAAGPDVLGKVTAGVRWDYGFIASYVLVLAFGCVHSGRTLAASWGHPWLKWLGWAFATLAVVAGAADVVENLGLLGELGGGDFATLAPRTCLAARVKFGLVLACAGFWFARPLGAMIRYATTHVVLILVVGIVYGFIYGLVGSGYGIASLFWNDDPLSRFLASFAVTMLLLELGVIVYYEQRDEPSGLVEVMAGPPPWARGGLVSSAENIAYLGKFLANNAWGFLLLVAAPAIDPRSFPYLPPIPTSEGPWLAGVGPWSLPWLLGIAAAVFISIGLLGLMRRLLPGGDVTNIGPPVRRFFGIFVLIYVALAVAYSFAPLRGVAAQICVLIAVVTMFYALMVYFADDVFPAFAGGWIKSRVILAVLLLALIVWANNDPFKLRFPGLDDYYPAWMAPWAELTPSEVTQACPPGAGEKPVPLRAPIDRDYLGVPAGAPPGGIVPLDDVATLDRWRALVGPGTGPKPKLAVVVVSGGATRSAYWSAYVLDRIAGEIPDFPDHVRIIAGASGGMVGAAFSVEELRLRRADPNREPRSFRSAVRTNSIDPLARYIAFRELWHAFLPVPWKTDRGVALEEDWGEIRRPFYVDYRKYEEDGKIPSLIISPMMVDDGRRLLISNLDLRELARTEGTAIAPDDPGTKSRLFSLTAVELSRLFPCASGFQLATAVRMNASFPYVSPAVNLPTNPPRRAVDAGYYDNYGVQIAAAWLEKNLTWLLDNTSGVVLVQARDAISREDRFGVVEPPGGLLGTIGRSFQFFTSPIQGTSQARYTVSAFRNDQDVEGLSNLFTDRLARRLADSNDEAKVEAQRGRARSFFATAIFENSTTILDGKRPVGSWPGDSIDGVPAANDVALDWYLSRAEREGLDAAIPSITGEPTMTAAKPQPANCAAIPVPPPGSLFFDPKDPGNAQAARNRSARIDWLTAQVQQSPADRRGLWIKALEQAENFERLIRLKQWWGRPAP